MKRIILQLMSEISTLTSPFNPVDISKIFAKHPPLDATQVPPELKKHVEQLLTLKILIEQSFDLANQRHSLSSQQERLILLAEEINTTQHTIDVLLDQMKQSIELVNTSFQELMPKINEHLLRQNKLTPLYSATVDNQTQKIAVEEYHAQLSKSLCEMYTRRAVLNLAELKQDINNLINELSTLGINLSAREGKNSLQKLISSISSSVTQLKDIKPKMIDLHQLFAKYISVMDVQTKIKDLELQTALIERELRPIELEIAINTLEPKIKERLSEEFQKSSRKSELIKAYQEKLPSALTYIDLYAWKSWIQDQHKYEVAQQEANNSVSYLQLLEKEHELNLDKHRLMDQKKILESVLPTAQSSEHESDINKLIGQTKIIFNECALLRTPIDIPSSSSASDFYLALLSYIPIIEQKLEHMAVVLIKLQTLETLETEKIQLRTQYNFETNIDSSLPATQQDFEQLVQLIENQKPAQEVLMQQHELCKFFLANATKLEEIKKQLQAAIIHKTDIERTLSVANLATPIQDQISIISGQLSDLRSVIAINIEQVRGLPLPSEQTEEEQDVSLIQNTAQSLLPHEQLALSVEGSIKLEPSSILELDSAPEHLYFADQTVANSTQTLVIEEAEHRQSISPAVIDTGLKPEHSLIGSQEHLADHSPISDALAPVSEQSLFVTEVSDEPIASIVPLSLNADHPSVQIEQRREEQWISSDIIVPALSPAEESPDSESLTTLPISLNAEQLSLPVSSQSIAQLTSSDKGSTVTGQSLFNDPVPEQQSLPPVPINLESNELLVPVPEQSRLQSTSSCHIVLPINQSFISEEVPTQHFVSHVPIDLKPGEPSTPIQDSALGQLTIFDESIATSKQPASGEGWDELLTSDEALTHVEESTVELMSNQIFSDLHPSLPAEKKFDDQLVSSAPVDLTLGQPLTLTLVEKLITSSPHTQRRSAEPLETKDDVGLKTNVSSSIIQSEFQKWQKCYQQSLPYLKCHPVEILQWYMDVYKAIEVNSNEDDSFQASHLMRDILFELQYKKDLDVIRAYMRLCPNPEKDLNRLLSLKPNLPLIDESSDEVTELQDTPTELKPLYAQYMKLKKDHPIEGKLLLQAIHSLRVAKIFIDMPNSDISIAQIPSLSEDPRYELLKRHRGFFKVWEAVEDFCRMLIGKIKGQAEFEYSKRPCFFRTKSAQLIEEADLMIQKDLLPICAT